ncbi:hypothetical protein [Frigoribacterium faeni]|uniref:Uncharacterized protein n=1 Tax=Frigoribacterium faeni TaxID=145483 RepID=A0A7W3JGZ3_9MICO|nr:hypothetical protein [Frigoribacterium faeni]MBA8812660.1 hypothetical protein [Frigoribacterium faeni]BFF13770.1 hypothetical protein GCM10025699_50730 [Microbacterium flavescens]GEK82327.1 hypothetical protein FFA01_06360 [Frigoribacterium faeni]
MATVTGTLSDFGYASLAPLRPEIAFIPSGAGVFGGRLMATRPVTVTPGTSGYFEVDLVPADDRWFQIRIAWLDPVSGAPDNDYVEPRLYVPELGGPIGHLLKAPSTPSTDVAWQPTAPKPWPVGLVWVNSITGRVQRQV